MTDDHDDLEVRRQTFVFRDLDEETMQRIGDAGGLSAFMLPQRIEFTDDEEAILLAINLEMGAERGVNGMTIAEAAYVSTALTQWRSRWSEEAYQAAVRRFQGQDLRPPNTPEELARDAVLDAIVDEARQEYADIQRQAHARPLHWWTPHLPPVR